MFTLGWRELVCVLMYTALVWGGHTLFRLGGRPAKPVPLQLPLHGDLLRAAGAFVIAFGLGIVLGRPLMPYVFTPAPMVADTDPTEAINLRYFFLPLLLAIFLSSPTWIALVSRDTPRSSLIPASLFILGGVLGALFILPMAGKQSFWDAILGPALILLAAPLSFRATRLARSPFFTPALMLTAAVATASTRVFVMTLVFLPMCVAAMAGVGMAEVVNAHSHGQKLEFSQIGGWGLRLMAESVLGAMVAAAILALWR